MKKEDSYTSGSVGLLISAHLDTVGDYTYSVTQSDNKTVQQLANEWNLSNPIKIIVDSQPGYILEDEEVIEFSGGIDDSYSTPSADVVVQTSPGSYEWKSIIAMQSNASGSFLSHDGKTVTVLNGVITSIV